MGKRDYEFEVMEEKGEEEEKEDVKTNEYWTLGGEEKKPEKIEKEEAKEDQENKKDYYEKLKETTGRTPFEFSYLKM